LPDYIHDKGGRFHAEHSKLRIVPANAPITNPVQTNPATCK
jgi:hypothetical protein